MGNIMPFFIVDVFSESSFSGNQLAVIVDNEGIDDDAMQRIAREFNFSESTFVKSSPDEGGEFSVRIFTPEKEIPFAGHPLLGTAWVIRNQLKSESLDSLILKPAGNSVHINFDEELIWIRQEPAWFSETLDLEATASVLGLNPADLDRVGPVIVASTGLPSIIVPVATLNNLKKAAVRREEYNKIIEGIEAKLLLLFSPEPYQPKSNFSVRVFADYYGVPEDPATGSAAGALAGYLFKYGYRQPGDGDIILDQGWEIGRPSRIIIRPCEKGVVKVGGQVRLFATGSLIY